MSKYSLDPIAPNCYPGTTVLINKFGTHDDTKLLQAEIEITQVAAAQWELSPLCDTFCFNHYKMIHKHLFQDIFDWAGQVRDVDISKKGTRFCQHTEIADLSQRVFAGLKKMNFYKGLVKKDFISEFVTFYITTNHLHPFREGNGRVQRLFLAQLTRNAGYTLDFADIDVDNLMVATIHSARGVRDGLTKIFSSAINLPQKASIHDNLKKFKELAERNNSSNSDRIKKRKDCEL